MNKFLKERERDEFCVTSIESLICTISTRRRVSSHISVFRVERKIRSFVLYNCAVGTFTSSLTNVTGLVVPILNRLN